MNKTHLQVWQGSKSPSLLKFPTGNTDKDWIDLGEQYIFSSDFYIELDFEYSALTSSYAGLIGSSEVSVGNFRVLINNSTILVSATDTTNISKSVSTSFNTRYKLKVRRDLSDNIWISIDGGIESNIGTRSGSVGIRSVSNADSNPRFLQGKVYSFDINGDKYSLDEGSGNKVNGILGGIGTIRTANINEMDHINNDMWESL